MWSLLKNKIRQISFIYRLWQKLNTALKIAENYISGRFPKRLHGMDLRNTKRLALSNRKKALLSYIVHPFSISNKDPRFHKHINIWRAPQIVKILNELGYIVDVIDYRDKKFIPRKRYDLFIGHGGINFNQIAEHLDENTPKICLTTENYWKFSHAKSSARSAGLRKRKGIDLPADRLHTAEEELALSIADGVIGIGNDFTRKTYAKFSPVIMINNSALFDNHFEHQQKDYLKGRENFLYFAGQGNIHKGLDLLLDAFVELEQHLWICSFLDKKFVEVYSKELFEYPNIHAVGWIQPRSDKFYEMMRTCNYAILPSCSEGQPHAIVECMNQGLIPIVTEACGLNTDGFGVALNTCTLDEIKKVVRKLAKLPVSDCQMMSAKAHDIARTDFSEDAFYRNIKNGIMRLIDSPNSRKRINQNFMVFDPIYVDAHHNIFHYQNALDRLQQNNDFDFLKQGHGVVKINRKRWLQAQCYERRSWMEGGGLKRREDRNNDHMKGFDNYSVLKGKFFKNVIEIGCGPFTNLRHMIKHIKCHQITLLDPLINEYLAHPHCAYKRKRLGGWLGKKVETVALPIEEFVPGEFYDLVVMINVLEHCFSLSRIFECLSSITARNGIIVFHDKLIRDDLIEDFVKNTYDTGHPLRVVESLILNYLTENYQELFRRHVSIQDAFGIIDSLYFIGKKHNQNI